MSTQQKHEKNHRGKELSETRSIPRHMNFNRTNTDLEMPHSQTADQPTAPRGRYKEHRQPHGSMNTKQSKTARWLKNYKGH